MASSSCVMPNSLRSPITVCDNCVLSIEILLWGLRFSKGENLLES